MSSVLFVTKQQVQDECKRTDHPRWPFGWLSEYKSMTNTPKPPLAVRLARFVYPDCGNIEASGSSAWEADGQKALVFDADSLDDLAKAERRVVEAGLGKDYAIELAIRTKAPSEAGSDDARTWAAIEKMVTATAPQRAAALEAVLDANPELEQTK